MISDNLIDELIKEKIITNRLCDRRKAQLIVREYLCLVYKNAVSETVIACNKQKYIEPKFFDL